MNTLPKARTADILEQEAGAELLVYDLRIDKAYTLNETSAIIYKACGRQTFDELKRRYKFTDDLIHLALDELRRNDLLEDYASRHFAGLSRREVVKKVGLGTMIALPIIAGITALPAASAASSRTSCAATGQSCVSDNFRKGNCCSSTQRCYGGADTCRDCFSPNSTFAVTSENSVAYCSAQTSKNLCCFSTGNASVRPGLYLYECVCPAPF